MDKRTLYAVLLSTIIIIVGFSIQTRFQEQPNDQSSTEDVEDPNNAQREQQSDTTNTQSPRTAAQAPGQSLVPFDDGQQLQCEPYFNNGTVEVAFSDVDAGISSLKLLQHLENDRPVDLIFKGDTVQNPFTVIIGDRHGYALAGRYACRKGSDYIEFTGLFVNSEVQEEHFVLKITYTFVPEEYLFTQEIDFRNSINSPIPLGTQNNISYSLFIGPQIGPQFEVLDNRFVYRKYITFDGRRRDRVRLGRRNNMESFSENIEWISIAGKYFVLAAIPPVGISQIVLSAEEVDGVPAASEIYLSRAPIQSSAQVDSYQFYFGPKQKKELTKYDQAENNALAISDLNLTKVQDARPLIGWLENILKWMLTLIYAVIPNYGVAIVILTVIVKIILTPLTRKSQQSTERMQALAPKISALREKFVHDKQRLNIEIAQLYKAEKVNPAGGCLPLLLQMPFFLAMFGIFNNHFELRNAPFIMGWIDDLSMPESILNFGDFTLPILGWNDLRLLPILYAISQFLSGYFSKNPGQTQQQSRMMMLMPLVLFFILYNLPSGLLVYWVITNMLMVVQQLITKMKKKRLISGSL